MDRAQFSKVPAVTDIGLKPRNVKKAAVIGGGLMGSGIATALILSNIHVMLKEVNAEYLQKGIKLIEGDYSSHVGEVEITGNRTSIANWLMLVSSLFHFMIFIYKQYAQLKNC